MQFLLMFLVLFSIKNWSFISTIYEIKIYILKPLNGQTPSETVWEQEDKKAEADLQVGEVRFLVLQKIYHAKLQCHYG